MGRINPFVRVQADLLVVIGIAVLSMVLFSVGDPPLPIRVGLIGGLLLVIPGYALSIALFPRGADPVRSDRGIDGIERAALTVGLSIAMLPPVGVMLASTPLGITRRTVVLVIGLTSMLAAIVGLGRRARLDPGDRFVPGIPVRSSEPRATVAATLTLVVAICITIGVLGFAVAMPQIGERTSEIYLLGGEDDETSGYPDEVDIDETVELELRVANDEHRTTSYTAVVLLESFDADGERDEYDELDRFSFELDHDETDSNTVEISPTIVGDDQRLSLLLYEGEPGSYVAQRTAYRHTHIWIDVTE